MEKYVNPHLYQPHSLVRMFTISILMLIVLSIAVSPGLAQDGSDVSFQADSISVEQENT